MLDAALLPEVLRPGVRLVRPRAAGSPPLGAGRRGAARRKKTLVVVFQRGACDGLNTVVPHGEERYRRLRPTIALPVPRRGSADAALDLDGFFGLHPALSPLAPCGRERSLAVVHAVGSPDHTRSHFDAQDFMESGTPGVKSTEDGWMNRHLQAQPGRRATPFRAVAVTPTLPALARRPRARRRAWPAIAPFAVRGGGAAFERMYASEASGAVDDTGREAFEALAVLEARGPAGRHAPAAGASYPRGRWGDSLRQVAAAREGRRRPGARVHRDRRLGPPRRGRARRGRARQPAARARPGPLRLPPRPRDRMARRRLWSR